MKHKSLFLILGVLVTVLVVVSCGEKPEQVAVTQEEEVAEIVEANQLTQAEIGDGWVLLFDGETATGWRGYGKDSFPAGWEVVERGAAGRPARCPTRSGPGDVPRPPPTR